MESEKWCRMLHHFSVTPFLGNGEVGWTRGHRDTLSIGLESLGSRLLREVCITREVTLLIGIHKSVSMEQKDEVQFRIHGGDVSLDETGGLEGVRG